MYLQQMCLLQTSWVIFLSCKWLYLFLCPSPYMVCGWHCHSDNMELVEAFENEVCTHVGMHILWVTQFFLSGITVSDEEDSDLLGYISEAWRRSGGACGSLSLSLFLSALSLSLHSLSFSPLSLSLDKDINMVPVCLTFLSLSFLLLYSIPHLIVMFVLPCLWLSV